MVGRDEDAARIDGPAPGGVGILIIDMINSMAFEGADCIRAAAEAACETILKIRAQADRFKTPLIYVNDNYGQWHSDKSRLVEQFSQPGCPGSAIVRKIARMDSLISIRPDKYSTAACRSV